MSIIIKYRKMTNTSAAEIAIDDLAAHNFGDSVPQPLSLTSKQLEELPSQVVVTYNDPSFDYNQNNQVSKNKTGEIGQEINIPIPVAISAQKARALADLIKFEAYTKQLSGFQFSLSNRFSKYEPTDVLTLPLGDDLIDVRITKKDQSGGIINFEASRHYSFVYDQDGIDAGVPLGYNGEILRLISPTLPIFFDTPLLRDQDNDFGNYMVFAKKYADGWNGANLFQSPDNGATFNKIFASQASATWGYVTAISTSFAGNNFDSTGYIDVNLVNGELSSTTIDAMLSTTNAAAVGVNGRWEILSFRDAELISTGVYRLKFFLRGRKGTENNINNHAISDYFVLIDTLSLTRINKSFNNIGAELKYKAVTYGQTFQDAILYSFKNTGNGLRPLSPVQGAVGFDGAGNRIINWVRRDRLNGGWNDNVDVPMSESELRYTLEFVDLSDNLKRSVSVTTESYTYTDYATDFPSGNGRVIIYQMSAIVGKGFPLVINLG